MICTKLMHRDKNTLIDLGSWLIEYSKAPYAVAIGTYLYSK